MLVARPIKTINYRTLNLQKSILKKYLAKSVLKMLLQSILNTTAYFFVDMIV